ncbi:MAG TPA: hypothetical protein P5052_01720 [Candidatus Paceibacterota bacterium]|nr:hypothetical protein [Candidatus Paceibacterota bacterium]
MNITKEQLKEYIQIQKKIRGVELTQEVALKEAQSLLLFVKTVGKSRYEKPKFIKGIRNNIV